MASDGKTEKATPKKKSDERKKGNIFQSNDITSSLGLLGIFVFLRVAGPYIFEYIKRIIIGFLTVLSEYKSLDISQANKLLRDFTINTLILSLPIAIVAALVGFIITIAQTKFSFTMGQMKFKFSRINFFSGLKKIISIKSSVELIKSMVKIIILGWVFYNEIVANFPKLLTIANKDISQALIWLGDTIFFIVLKVSLVMIAFGVLDYVYQWWDYERQIKMTKQQIKDEYKQTEGDPQIKGRIKDQQRRLAAMRMMEKVPLADVVIRNPTHYAVAINYDAKKDISPKLLAKGQDYLALKIIEIAQLNGIAITENRPLARGLYESVEIDQKIPSEFYQAVAEVLAFVYNLKKKNRSRSRR